MQDFRKLRVWHAAKALGLEVYRATRSYPPEELYGLVSQMRRSARSVSGNIAEACGFESGKETARLLRSSIASSGELWSDLIFSHELGYLQDPEFLSIQSDLVSLRRQLIRLHQRVRN